MLRCSDDVSGVLEWEWGVGIIGKILSPPEVPLELVESPVLGFVDVLSPLEVPLEEKGALVPCPELLNLEG